VLYEKQTYFFRIALKKMTKHSYIEKYWTIRMTATTCPNSQVPDFVTILPCHIEHGASTIYKMVFEIFTTVRRQE